MSKSLDLKDDLFILLVGLAGMIPVGLLALWAFAVDGTYYETAIKMEFASCPTIADCRVPQQCRINAAIIKDKYLDELNGSVTGLLYKFADYPTINVGFPVGTDDDFLIPICEPSSR